MWLGCSVSHTYTSLAAVTSLKAGPESLHHLTNSPPRPWLGRPGLATLLLCIVLRIVGLLALET
jgi:hypothetical protein